MKTISYKILRLSACAVLGLMLTGICFAQSDADIDSEIQSIRADMRADKVAIISGAASGMGAATARMFAREGAKVVIGDVLEHEGRQVAEAMAPPHGSNRSM